MKRLFFLTIILTGISFMVSSCEKCTVCTASSLAGESVDEYCGNELDVRDFEDFFIDSVADLEQAAYCERGPYDE